MIIVLPQKDAEAICDAIRAKGYTAEKMTAERAGVVVGHFMEVPSVISVTKPAAVVNPITFQQTDFVPSIGCLTKPAAVVNPITFQQADFVPSITTNSEVT